MLPTKAMASAQADQVGTAVQCRRPISTPTADAGSATSSAPKQRSSAASPGCSHSAAHFVRSAMRPIVPVPSLPRSHVTPPGRRRRGRNPAISWRESL